MTTLHSTSPLNLLIFHPTLYNPSEASIAKREIEFKKYAPKFNMQVCTFTQFLKLFKIATNGYRISKDCYKITLFQSLLGSAAALAQGCSPLEEPYRQMGPDEYVSKLKKIFEPDAYKHALWNQYNGRVQQLKEPTVHTCRQSMTCTGYFTRRRPFCQGNGTCFTMMRWQVFIMTLFEVGWNLFYSMK